MYKHVIYIGLVATLLSGCKTMTHHSNTLYFGTSTTVGIKVGASQTAVPEIKIGYDRNEGVAMPLLANKDYTNDNLPEACNDTDMTKCMFLGKLDGNTDTYSVLASFGAKVSGSGRASDVEAKVGLAQYFATGHAAIALAETGGAAVVAVGDAASATANAKAEKSKEIQALIAGGATAQEAAAISKNVPQRRTKLNQEINASYGCAKAWNGTLPATLSASAKSIVTNHTADETSFKGEVRRNDAARKSILAACNIT